MSAPHDPTAAGGPPVRPAHEPADVPAELDETRRRPRRRPPRQSEIRGINTIASLPEVPPDPDELPADRDGVPRGPDDDGGAGTGGRAPRRRR